MQRKFLRLKGCPKCGGDILIDMAMEDGEVCIQCGYRRFTVMEEPEPLRNLAGTKEIGVRSRSGRHVFRKM